MNELPLSLGALEGPVGLTNLHRLSPAANAVAQCWQRAAQHWFRVMQDRHDPAPKTIRGELAVIEDCFWSVCNANDERAMGDKIFCVMVELREQLCELAAANIAATSRPDPPLPLAETRAAGFPGGATAFN